MINTLRLTDETQAARLLQQGKLLAFPTETVFGLGADATNAGAVAAIFEAKGRPDDNPLIVHLADVDDWPMAARDMTSCARVLLSAFAPGPLTVILPKASGISDTCTAGLDSVGIRIPACHFAREILRQAKLPIAAPSANRSGRPSCTTWQAVLEDLDGRIDAVFCQNPDLVGLESTVVDCLGDVPVILRPGAVTLGDIQQHFPTASLSPQIENANAETAVRSPGLRHAHYQPRAEVRLFRDVAELEALVGTATGRTTCCWMMPLNTSWIECQDALEQAGMSRRQQTAGRQWMWCKKFNSLKDYAAGFYEFLRESDRRGADCILVHLVEDQGFAQALRDRQLRSAGAK